MAPRSLARAITYPDGKYLIKGGGAKVWKIFRLRKEHRRLQGIIHGKRCGTTQNIGRAARDACSQGHNDRGLERWRVARDLKTFAAEG